MALTARQTGASPEGDAPASARPNPQQLQSQVYHQQIYKSFFLSKDIFLANCIAGH
jgi:hypothetical protein